MSTIKTTNVDSEREKLVIRQIKLDFYCAIITTIIFFIIYPMFSIRVAVVLMIVFILIRLFVDYLMTKL